MRATFSLGTLSSTSGVGRPSYNTGIGLFVLNGVLYDSHGIAFRIRGVNRHDLTVTIQPSVSLANANSIRIDSADGLDAAGFASDAAATIAAKQVPIISAGWTTGGTSTSGSTNTADLTNVTGWWVSNFSSFSSLQKHMIVNIASEWGPANSTTWRDSYITAISALRTAGYTCPFMIDTGGSGQDINDLLSYSTAVFNSDSQKNVLFGIHLYSNATAALAGSPNYLQQLATLSASAGMPFGVFEFGDAADDGTATPATIITAAEASGLGWSAWAWDEAGDNFQMCVTPGLYTGLSSDLTTYGQAVVPYMQSLAVRATDFP